jgi:hypothetical protein
VYLLRRTTKTRLAAVHHIAVAANVRKFCPFLREFMNADAVQFITVPEGEKLKLGKLWNRFCLCSAANSQMTIF